MAAPAIDDLLRAFVSFATDDVRRYRLRTMGRISRRRLAKEALLDEGTLRGMEELDWEPSLRTLTSMTAAHKSAPEWSPKEVDQLLPHRGDDGFIVRRRYRASEEPDVEVILQAYLNRSSDSSFLEWASGDDRVSVIDWTSEDPAEYRVVRHAMNVSNTIGTRKTNTTFADNASATYREAVQEDYKACKDSGAPTMFDVFWSIDNYRRGSYYKRLIMPLGNLAVAWTFLIFWKPAPPLQRPTESRKETSN